MSQLSDDNDTREFESILLLQLIPQIDRVELNKITNYFNFIKKGTREI